jgi:carbon-monoxide dehydrogenase small subunit
MMKIELNVNGDIHELNIKPEETLADVLRERLNLKGTKKGCDYGGCGACTVVIDGKPVYSCSTFAASAQGKKIITIEGLSKDGQLHPLQRAFLHHGAYQCGFCTPGMIMTLHGTLNGRKNITQEEIREAIRGNICRCTGYVKIVEAVIDCAKGGSHT